MPCTDVTEILSLRLDEADRLTGYTLFKRTCGRAVGERSLLADMLAGRGAEEIVGLDPAQFVLGIEDETEEFLRLKHFFAVKSGLDALLGRCDAGRSAPLSVATVSYDPARDETCFEAEIAVDVLTDAIRACGHCRGCPAPQKAST